MGIRHEAREWALQFLFQSEFNRAESLDEGLQLFWQHLDQEPGEAKKGVSPSPPTPRRGKPARGPRPGALPRNWPAA
jgi:transcription termination factor NusB